MKHQALFLRKAVKKFSRLLSAAVVIGTLRVKMSVDWFLFEDIVFRDFSSRYNLSCGYL